MRREKEKPLALAACTQISILKYSEYFERRYVGAEACQIGVLFGVFLVFLGIFL